VKRVDESFFVEVSYSPRSSAYLATSATTGPWSDVHQHGGPPSALLVHVAESLVRDELDRHDLDAMRIAVEFPGPVPVGEVHVQASVIRAARSAVLVETQMHAHGRLCLLARVWLVTRADPPPGVPLAQSLTIPDDAPGWRAFSFPYADALEWKAAPSVVDGLGTACSWIRQRIPLLPGQSPTGLQRAALVADSGNGLSAMLDWSQWSFMNVDLDVHLARPLDGEWVRLDASTQLGPTGTGLARSTLSDVTGPCGAGMQTLVVRQQVSVPPKSIQLNSQ
jgi:Thioesterase-like superfamily